MTAPNKPTPYVRPYVSPAPILLKNWRCSECNVPSILIANGDLRICPRCYALLWHQDWSAEARKARSDAALAAEYARLEVRAQKEDTRRELERQKRQRHAERTKIGLSAEGLITATPELGAPTLTENKDDIPISPPEPERTDDH
jgi:hypothetical protein